MPSAAPNTFAVDFLSSPTATAALHTVQTLVLSDSIGARIGVPGIPNLAIAAGGVWLYATLRPRRRRRRRAEVSYGD
jgi:hypothetical protein